MIKHDKPINPNYTQWVGYADRIQDSYLNVRTNAGVEYPNLPQYPRLAQGNKVRVVSEKLSPDNRLWYQIIISEQYYGWVRSDYITPVGNVKVKKVYNTQRLVVRSEPKVSKDTIYQPHPYLGNGNMVDVFDDTSDKFFDRIRIKTGDNEYHIAYASRAYLKEV